MEGTHGELGTGLADGLRRNDADGFTDVDHVTAGQIAPVAQDANATAAFAGEHRTNLDLRDACILDDAHLVFGDFLVRLHQHFAGVGIEDVVDRDTAQNTIAELLDDLATLFERRDFDAFERTAVVLRDDAVLGDVDKTAGEVT